MLDRIPDILTLFCVSSQSIHVNASIMPCVGLSNTVLINRPMIQHYNNSLKLLSSSVNIPQIRVNKANHALKAVPLHAMKALGGRGV
jgi:hypothetical protein